MKRTDSASRVIAASRSAIYEAIVDPNALVVWLPPNGMSGKFEWFELRGGGGYRLVLTLADSSSSPGKATPDADIVEARFVELVAAERVVQSVDFESDDPAFAGTMTMTWSLTATEEGTRVEIRADNVPVGISAEDHATGIASSLANLADYLAR
jgi:uncharacterized protein YndB with AHSA1/START domain